MPLMACGPRRLTAKFISCYAMIAHRVPHSFLDVVREPLAPAVISSVSPTCVASRPEQWAGLPGPERPGAREADSSLTPGQSPHPPGGRSTGLPCAVGGPAPRGSNGVRAPVRKSLCGAIDVGVAHPCHAIFAAALGASGKTLKFCSWWRSGGLRREHGSMPLREQAPQQRIRGGHPCDASVPWPQANQGYPRNPRR
jgi:hypothetical protein